MKTRNNIPIMKVGKRYMKNNLLQKTKLNKQTKKAKGVDDKKCPKEAVEKTMCDDEERKNIKRNTNTKKIKSKE